MNNLDEAAWQREFDHVEAKQKKEQVTFSGGHSYEAPECIYSNEIYLAKDGINEE